MFVVFGLGMWDMCCRCMIAFLFTLKPFLMYCGPDFLMVSNLTGALFNIRDPDDFISSSCFLLVGAFDYVNIIETTQH